MVFRFGKQCIEAHATEELEEWKDRYSYRSMKLERAKEKQLHGASYADQLLEKLGQVSADKIFTEQVTIAAVI